MRSVVLRTGLFLALLPLLIGAPSGVLLCNGADGHLALELAQPEAASLPASPSTAAAVAPAPACYCDAGCGPCEDTDVGLGPTISRFSDRRAADEVRPTQLYAVMDLEPLARECARNIAAVAPALLPPMCSQHEQATIRLLV